VRLRATVVVEYDADFENYQTHDPEEAAKIDQQNWTKNFLDFVCCFEPEQLDVKVEVAPVQANMD
jgi:hypothetical protein